MAIDVAAIAVVMERHPVVCAYLFGSQASGRTSPLSDVDVAVLLEPGVEAPSLVQADIASDLMLALRRSDVDVVVLGAVAPLLAHRAISTGRLVFCRDDAARVRFEVATRRQYFDTQPLRDRQDRALLERWTGGR